MSGLYLEPCTSNLKSLALIVLQLLAFYTQKLGDHVTLATLPFEKFLRVHIRNVNGNMPVKFDVLTFWSY